MEFHENSTSGLADNNRSQAKQTRPVSKEYPSRFSRKLKKYISNFVLNRKISAYKLGTRLLGVQILLEYLRKIEWIDVMKQFPQRSDVIRAVQLTVQSLLYAGQCRMVNKHQILYPLSYRDQDTSQLVITDQSTLLKVTDGFKSSTFYEIEVQNDGLWLP